MSNQKVDIMDIDIIDRKKVGTNISVAFNGRVPTEEKLFNEVITEEKASDVMKTIIEWYETIGFELTYTIHDLFVIYNNTMR